MRRFDLCFLICFVLFVIGCSGVNDGYKTSKSGLLYRFYMSNNDAEKPNVGDVLMVSLSYSVDDSVIYHSDSQTKDLRIILKEDNNGGLHEGLGLMHKGDSVSFLFPVDTILKLFGKESLPQNISPKERISINLKLNDFMNKQEFALELENIRQAKIAAADALVKSYVENNGIMVQPSASGVYYIETKRGRGNKVKKGEKAQIHYVAMFLNDQIFDTTLDTLVGIVIGADQIFPGMEEGLMNMRKGGKATLIIPYNQALGEEGNDLVPAFTPLRIDVELVNIESEEMVKKEEKENKEKAKLMAKQQFDSYVIDNNLKDNLVFNGLTYTRLINGNGPRPVNGSNVKVHYIGKLIDGTVFDSSYDRNQPFEFVLGKGDVLPGWNLAVSLMSEGEKASFVMSEELAYRDYSLGVIKPYSNLIYEIELIDVK